MNQTAQEQIVQLIQSRQYQEALNILKDHLKTEPNDWYAYYMSGIATRFMGNIAQTIIHLLKAAEVKPGQAPVLLALGIAYQMSGRLEEAVDSFKEAIALSENLIEAYNSLGLTYKKMGRLNDALKSYEKGTDCLVKLVLSEVHKNPELCYRDEVINGKVVRTVLPYVHSRTFELLKSNLLYAALRNNTGVSLAGIGDIEGARKMYQEAIECTPDGCSYPDPARNLENLDE